MRRKKNDKVMVGFTGGIFLPIVVFLVLYYLKYTDISLEVYLENLWFNGLTFKVLSLCVFPNLLLFLLYIRKKKDFAAKGVVAATIVYALIVLFSKIF